MRRRRVLRGLAAIAGAAVLVGVISVLVCLFGGRAVCIALLVSLIVALVFYFGYSWDSEDTWC